MRQKEMRRRWHGRELLSTALHVTAYGGCLILFFALLAIPNWPLRHLSRTSATTLVTWCAMGAAMTAVFGGMEVRRGKKRQRMAGQCLGVLITDAVTYLQLEIMNVNPNNNAHLMLLGEDFAYLLVCVALQMTLLGLLSGFGARALPHVESLRPLLLITGEERQLTLWREKLEKEDAPWRITAVCHWQDVALAEQMAKADAVLLASDIPAEERMMLIRQCYALPKTVLISPTVQEIMLAHAKPTIVDDAPLMEMRMGQMTLWQSIIKRSADVVISAVLLVLLMPLMVVIALLIRLEDGGPVLFRQKRMTQDGHSFRICKFRTMRQGTPPVSAQVDDARVTRVGRVLRLWRLDELPQLYNILRGDMSLVGPRPEMLENVMRYKQTLPEFCFREKMRAGLTGYAQIEGRYNTSPEDKLALDLMYIEGFSLWTDVKLLLRTVTVLFRPDSTQGFQTQPERTESSSVIQFSTDAKDNENRKARNQE